MPFLRAEFGALGGETESVRNIVGEFAPLLILIINMSKHNIDQANIERTTARNMQVPCSSALSNELGSCKYCIHVDAVSERWAASFKGHSANFFYAA